MCGAGAASGSAANAARDGSPINAAVRVVTNNKRTAPVTRGPPAASVAIVSQEPFDQLGRAGKRRPIFNFLIIGRIRPLG